MKTLILTISTLFVIVKDAIGQDDGISLYSRRYERLDIDTILASPRLVTNYVDCLLSKKPCPPEGKALKRILPEALRTKCGRCWPSQKEGALKVITALYSDYPQHYQALRERWDPTGEYHRRFEEYLRDQKFNVINSNGGQDDSGDTSQIPQSPPPIKTTTSTTTKRSTTKVKKTTPEIKYNSPSVPTRTPTTRRVQRIPQTTITTTTPRPLPGFVTHTTINTNNPILNIISHLTLKVANTAELLAGMINGATPHKKVIKISTPIFTIEKRYGPR